MTKRRSRKRSRRDKEKRRRHRPQLPRRTWYGIVLVALVVACAVFLFWPRVRQGLPAELIPESAAGFNVLLITLDTTRADHLGCYGYDDIETPALDALANEGILFADAVCNAPTTLPSHATILTGLDPPNHGARHNGQFVVGPEQVSLAEVLHDAGYKTAAFISAFVLDSRFGLDQGFALFDDDIGVAQSSGMDAELNQRLAGSVTSAAIQWFNGLDPNRPFFAWVHYYDPHSPYKPPPSFAVQYRGRPYDGEIAYMDSEIANLLRILDARGLKNNTLIVVVGDHGESLGEHNEQTHERLIYESVMHIPLIISCPGLFQGPYVVDDVVVSAADVFPTVLDLLGIHNNRQLDAVSLLDAERHPDRVVYQESLAPYLDDGWAPLFGLRRHHDKYILAPRPEYYDLDRDPDELDNLYAGVSGQAAEARDNLVADLAARLEQWPSLSAVVASTQEVDAETRHRLESLGYLGEVTDPQDEGNLPDPKDMMPVMNAIDRANVYVRQNRLDQALVAIKKGAALSPGNPRVLRTMGKILLFMGHEREAQDALRRSIALRPNADACLLLAQFLIAKGRYAEANPILDQAEDLEPLHGGVQIARGDMAALQGGFEAAIAAYRRAEEIDPYRVTMAARARIKQTQEQMAAASGQ